MNQKLNELHKMKDDYTNKWNKTFSELNLGIPVNRIYLSNLMEKLNKINWELLKQNSFDAD